MTAGTAYNQIERTHQLVVHLSQVHSGTSSSTSKVERPHLLQLISVKNYSTHKAVQQS